MSIGKYCKGFLLTFFIYSNTYAGNQVDKFDIKSGVVFYSIQGGGALTKETNLSIVGSAKLRFREWGSEMLLEEGGTVITTGSIKHKQVIQRLEKHTLDKIISVDYENEQILERKKSKVTSSELEETEGLFQQGEEEVAGHVCKIWIGPGIQKCIYKGVVLKQESHILGVSYIKVATQTLFDVNVLKEECVVPDYPVHKFGLFKDNIKTKNSMQVDNFCEILRQTSFDLKEECVVPDYPVHKFGLFKDNIKTKNSMQVDNFCEILRHTSFDLKEEKANLTKFNLEDRERQKFINHIGKDIFKRQKELLPKLLDALKHTRACLQTGDDPFSVNQCLEHFSRLKEQLGTDGDDYIILWDEERKNELLDKIEDEVIYVQSRMSCVKRAKNITDLSTCMK